MYEKEFGTMPMSEKDFSTTTVYNMLYCQAVAGEHPKELTREEFDEKMMDIDLETLFKSFSQQDFT